MSGRDQGTSETRVQSFLWETTQQGDTFVPGAASERSRSERVNSALEAVDQQFPNSAVTEQNGHGPQAQNSHEGTNTDLIGVGHHFQR